MKNKGFTLLELLIVIALIGLLSSIVLVGFKDAKERANIARGLHFSGQVKHYLGYWAVGIWDFNEIKDGNKVYDSSGNNNHGTVYGATLVKSIPELGNALSFDGNDFIQIANADSINITNSITIEAWIKVNSLPFTNYSAILEKRTSGTQNGYAMLGQKDGNTVFMEITNLGVKVSSSALQIGQWYHIIGTWNGTTGVAQFYLNGILTSQQSGKFGSITQNDSNLKIGQRTITADAFNGLIDEVRIYKQAMEFGQIQKLYAEGAKRYGIAFNEK